MNIRKAIEGTFRYLSGAVTRIFSPSDHSYPATGAQPFDGEIKRKPSRSADS